MRLFPRFFLALVLAVAWLSPALAEKRIALVIGNSDYELISPLANPKNDARLIAETLRAVGFDVVTAENAGVRDMARAVRNFGRKLRAAGPDAVGLFYYAGHGVQAKGANYLIPLGADIQTEADLDIEAMTASDVLSQMEDAGNALNIVILDACRNNPFKSGLRSTTRGLTRMNAPSGSLVAFAAAPGQTAADGLGANSPYTAALAAAMREPGLSVEQVFKRVRVEVEASTGAKQTPWEESSLKGDFYFIAPNSTVNVTVPQGSTTVLATDKEALFWQSIQGSEDVEAYEAYLVQYPGGTFAGLARLQIKKLKSKQQTAALTPSTQTAPEAPPLSIEDIDDTYFALKNANVRSGPGTSFGKVGRLNAGDEVEVTGRVVGKNWLRIAFAGDQVAYVYAPLVGEVPLAAPSGEAAPALSPSGGGAPSLDKARALIAEAAALVGRGDPQEEWWPIAEIALARATMGDFKGARQDWRRAKTKLNALDQTMRDYAIGTIAGQQAGVGLTDEALGLIAELSPDSYYKDQFFEALMKQYVARGDMNAAADLARRSEDLDYAVQGIAERLIAEGRHDDAVSLALARPISEWPLENVAEALSKKGSPRQEKKVLRVIFDAKANDGIIFLVDSALGLARVDDFNWVISEMNRRFEPWELIIPYESLIEKLVEKGDYRTANKLLEEVGKLSRDERIKPYARHYYMARGLVSLGRLDLAIERIDQSESMLDRSAIYQRTAKALGSKGRKRQAETLLEKALKLARQVNIGSRIQTMGEVAIAYHEIGYQHEAREVLAKAEADVKLFDTDARALLRTSLLSAYVAIGDMSIIGSILNPDDISDTRSFHAGLTFDDLLERGAIEDALSLIGYIDDGYSRRSKLEEVVPRYARQNDPGKIIGLAQHLGDREDKDDLLEVGVASLIEEDHPDSAAVVAGRITEADDKASALRDVAYTFARSGEGARAQALLQSIEDPEQRSSKIDDVARELAGEGRGKEAIALAGLVATPAGRANFLLGLAQSALSQDHRAVAAQAVALALPEIPQVGDVEKRDGLYFSASRLQSFMGVDPGRAAVTARKISNRASRAGLLALAARIEARLTKGLTVSIND